MKTLKRIGIYLGIIVILLLVISLFLPGKVHVERTEVIKADPMIIFNQVNDLKNWPKWAPWFDLDPNMVVSYEGADAGTGASYSWQGNKKVGAGKLTITDSKPVENINMKIDFTGHGSSAAAFKFNVVPEGTQVTWGMDMDMGMNPVGKYFGLVMDQMMGGDFENGLNELKKVSESYAPPVAPEINPMPEDSASQQSTGNPS